LKASARERLAQLLTELTDTLQHYQAQQTLMTKALQELQGEVKASEKLNRDRLTRQEEKMVSFFRSWDNR